MTSHTEVTTLDKLTILKLLATGNGIGYAAAASNFDRDVIQSIAAKHGYPDTDNLSKAIAVLKKKVADAERGSIPQTEPAKGELLRADPPAGFERFDRPKAARPTGPHAVSAPATAAPAPQVVDSTAQLLLTAKQLDSKRIQGLVDRISTQLGQLRDLVAAEETKRADKERTEREAAAAKAEIARLTEQLAAARAKLRPAAKKTTSKATKRPESAASTVRAWAAANGVPCAARGAIPAAVQDAYVAAHQDGAA